MQILVKDLVKSLDYKLTYFFKILTKSNVKSRIILDEEDLFKILQTVKVTNEKSYRLHLHISNLLKCKVKVS